MLKTHHPYWIGYYFGQSCILHAETGKWTLTGYFDGQVVCHRVPKLTINQEVRERLGFDNLPDIDEMPEEDCLMCDISEVQFVLKKINPFLFKALCKFSFFIKTKALDGYWMNFDESFTNNIIFEG